MSLGCLPIYEPNRIHWVDSVMVTQVALVEFSQLQNKTRTRTWERHLLRGSEIDRDGGITDKSEGVGDLHALHTA